MILSVEHWGGLSFCHCPWPGDSASLPSELHTPEIPLLFLGCQPYPAVTSMCGIRPCVTSREKERLGPLGRAPTESARGSGPVDAKLVLRTDVEYTCALSVVQWTAVFFYSVHLGHTFQCIRCLSNSAKGEEEEKSWACV